MPSIDEVLRSQERNNAALLATLEPIPDNPDLVKCTPYLRGDGCLCTRSLRLRRKDIEDVEETDIEAACCGKLLKVFRVHLHTTANVPLSDVVPLFQLQNVAEGARESCNCDALFEQLFSLQEELREAPTPRKAALVRLIREQWKRIRSCGC